jgi:hypothetical protein
MLGPVGKFARKRPIITAGITAATAMFFGVELLAAGLIGAGVAVVARMGGKDHHEGSSSSATHT